MAPYADDAAGDDDASHLSEIEGISSDGSDRQPIGRVWNPVWNDHSAARTGVSCNRDGAIIGHVRELGLHHGWQR